MEEKEGGGGVGGGEGVRREVNSGDRLDINVIAPTRRRRDWKPLFRPTPAAAALLTEGRKVYHAPTYVQRVQRFEYQFERVRWILRQLSVRR
jgi:hypothetical protein